jgi:secreted trypsin-like serine protease
MEMRKVIAILLINLIVVISYSNCINLERTPQWQRKRQTYSSLIVGGRPADIREFPHHLALVEYERFICGASVISLRWALTAAHCLEFGTDPKYLKLYGGSTSRLRGGIEFDVESYTIHPEFDWHILDFDVAVIKSQSPLTGSVIRSVVIANEQCRTIENTSLRLAGWGLNENSMLPENLVQITQTVMDQGTCKQTWGGDITERMICAQVVNGKDSCDGDSGGAVLQGGLQVGIISFGAIRCGERLPAVYTRIEHPAIRSFIRLHTGV